MRGLQDFVTLQHWADAVRRHSDFLARELDRHPEFRETALGPVSLDRPLPERFYASDLAEKIAETPTAELARALAHFRRRHYLRIVVRDVQAMATLAETTADLSQLADAILDGAYHRVREDLVREFGAPIEEGGGKAQMAVIALGKLGGEELNYSSDVDLMFVYSANGHTDGATPISNKEFFKKLANAYTALLSTYTSEGLCYRVDLRLRPEGRLGEIAISLEAARQYYRHRARDWELQMLIKARVCAGDPATGNRLLAFVEPLIYSTTLDFRAVESVSDARLRIHEKNAQRSGARDVKLAPGGIRDIEFLVQCLQRLHGGREPWVRHGGTLLALSRLHDKDLLSAVEYSDLVAAYEFLRHVEHRLQLVDDRQTHALPASAQELDLLAKRMASRENGVSASADAFLARLEAHLDRVQQIYERVIHAQKPIYYGLLVEMEDLLAANDVPESEELSPVSSNLIRFLDQAAPVLAAAVAQRPIRRNGAAFERFLDYLSQRPEDLKAFAGDSQAAAHAIDIFEHSQWLADALHRHPEYALELRDLGLARRVEQPMNAGKDAGDIRRRFHAGMVRILADSLCLQRPIFDTLLQTSALADSAIEAAYRNALAWAAQGGGLGDPAYRPRRQMMVVALGRLGMLEFDVSSDADLIFVLADEDESELPFWTRVAERLIDLLSAYTGDGTVFAVDTRLRAGGRDGPLVQLEKTYKEYFETRAEAWEGIAYMKARAVAGDLDRATAFLSELQQLDWRRYGQSGRSKLQLAEMRARLEREQGGVNPLKAARGGYYDIDFALMFLRLRGAGMFFKALNTPQRIDIVEQMGHLERADANFLRDAATFYRAIDHGLRLQTGQARGQLPGSGARLQQLTEMVQRWTPAHLHDQALDVELAQIQTRTREYFDRLFTP